MLLGDGADTYRRRRDSILVHFAAHSREIIGEAAHSGLNERSVGQDLLTSTAVDVHTSANMEHATAVMQTGVRHNMTFDEMAMHGLGQ